MPAILMKLFGSTKSLLNPKFLMVLLLTAFLTMSFWVFKKLDTTNELLAKAEIERSIIENRLELRNDTITEIGLLLSEAQSIRDVIQKQNEVQKKELQSFVDRITNIEFDTMAKQEPVKARDFVNHEYNNRLSCIEQASGNTDASCER